MDAYVRSTQQAAAAMGIRLTLLRCSTDAELEAAFAQLAREWPDALCVSTSGVVFMQPARVIE